MAAGSALLGADDEMGDLAGQPRGHAPPTGEHLYVAAVRYAFIDNCCSSTRRLSWWLIRVVYVAVALTGVIWSRYSLIITPKNWNLFAVNVFMGVTGITQLYRKATYVSWIAV